MKFCQLKFSFPRKNFHKYKKNIIAKTLLKTIDLPQSTGKKYGGQTKIGKAKIIKNPILYTQETTLFFSLILVINYDKKIKCIYINR